MSQNKMNIDSKYDPAKVEDKWYQFWLDNDYFKSSPDQREAYSIVIPPPNVTGVLHMGHMLNNTIQDILIRRARLLGKNACWVPGTDHASIATEAKVVSMLAGKGIYKNEIGREKFLDHAWDWKEKHDGIIFNQLKKLGASCDWDRAKFTLDPNLYEAVIGVFMDLYAEGKIYRGARMINWDPKAKTALSDEEVTRKEVNSKLYYVKYKIKDSEDFITIATTRPETILGDSAICVHPDDKRYRDLKGNKIIIPIVEREVPVIFDDYIDMEFGTGALKVTPAHDINDYELGIKHNLEVIDTLNDDGTLSEKAGFYIGQDRFAVRKKIVSDLESDNRILKVEEIVNNVGYSERNPDTVVEPKISTQWFLKMEEIVKPAIEAVKADDVKIYPTKFKKVYYNWLENINDWCISRQLWWGHRIPAWYAEDGSLVVAKNEKRAIEKFKEKGLNVTSENIRQDEDVLDTWFSSWLWPFSVFNWSEDSNNKDLEYYYPTNDLVTGHDIIFFWVARMIMAGYQFTNKRPFKNVYFTGMVRDKQGRKMSKQLGNSPDALELIKKFGADGVRVGMMLTAPAGNDLRYDDSLCLQGRNFANKIWNAFRLVKGWETDDNKTANDISIVAGEWFESKMNQTVQSLNVLFDQFRISEALMATYKLIWDDFCSWYLEMVKPAYSETISKEVYLQVLEFFNKMLTIVHPFMPFISEEIYQQFPDKNQKSIVLEKWPEEKEVNAEHLMEMSYNQQLISALRQFRKENKLSFKKELKLITSHSTGWRIYQSMVGKMANVGEFSEEVAHGLSGKALLVEKAEFFIPMEQGLDVEEEKNRILKEIEYNVGFLKSVEGKLKNEKFVSNAPEQVVAMERKKVVDARAKLEILKKQLDSL